MSRHKNMHKLTDDDYYGYEDDYYDDYGDEEEAAGYDQPCQVRPVASSSSKGKGNTMKSSTNTANKKGENMTTNQPRKRRRSLQLYEVNKVKYELEDHDISASLVPTNLPKTVNEAFDHQKLEYDIIECDSRIVPRFQNRRYFTDQVFRPQKGKDDHDVDISTENDILEHLARKRLKRLDISDQATADLPKIQQDLKKITLSDFNPSQHLDISYINRKRYHNDQCAFKFNYPSNYQLLNLIFNGQKYIGMLPPCPNHKGAKVKLNAQSKVKDTETFNTNPKTTLPIPSKPKPMSEAAAAKAPTINKKEGFISKFATSMEQSNFNKKLAQDDLNINATKETEKSVTSSTKGGDPQVSIPTPKPIVKELNKSISSDAILSSYAKERGGKPMLNMVIIGHVDAGKSTLMGRLLVDMGMVTQKQMHRNETDSKKIGKASFLYAWVLDETEEERERGITMDVAQSFFETTNRRVTILDAPGHRDFIPNMITGASQADVALLVVDATRGEFESGFNLGGQTREHTMLVRSLGVGQLCVVVNKLDNCDWEKGRFEEIRNQLLPFLKQTGFSEKNLTFIPASGMRGENLTKKATNPQLTSWYKGPSVLEIVDSFQPPERPVTKPFRMAIGDIFKGVIAGLSVSGKIDSGYIKKGMKVTIYPAKESAEVKGINVDEAPIDEAFAGDNISLILQGCDANNVSVGSIICDPSSQCMVSSTFEARIVVFASCLIPITKGLPCVVHFSNISEGGVIKKLSAQVNKGTAQVIKKNPRCLTRNLSGIVTIKVERAICVEPFSMNKDLGRFMLRYNGTTIAAGLVDKVIQ